MNKLENERLNKVKEEMVKARAKPSTATSEEAYAQMDRALSGVTSKEDHLIRTVYNTGDQIWTSYRDGKTKVVRVITHDGVFWEEGMSSLGSIKQAPLGGGGDRNERLPWFSSLSSKLELLTSKQWWLGLWFDLTENLFGLFMMVFIVAAFTLTIQLLLRSL